MGVAEQYSFKATAETTQVQMDTEQIVYALEHDCEFLLNFFLAEELDFPVPEFHKSSWKLLTSTALRRIALALPREHAKTTLARLAVVWYLLFTDLRFILYVSNTATVAAESCKVIMDFMRSDNFVSVFGEVEFLTEQDQRGFYKFVLRRLLPNGQVKEKVCILKPLGAGQQIRGLNIDNVRPELTVVDDLEDEANAGSDTLIQKLKNWFYGSFLKALSKKRSKIIYLGNMLSNKSLLHSFCQDDSGWAYSRSGCLLSNGEPLWPDLWPIEEIRQDFLDYQREGMIATWFAEMMNIPVAGGGGIIQGEDIRYVEPIVPGQQQAAFITIDPAFKQKSWNDNTAIVCHALYNSIWRPVEYISGKYTPDQIFYLTVQMAIKWRTRVVGIEAAGYQEALKFIFDVLTQTHTQRLEVVMVSHGNRAKTERLSSWCAFIRKYIWALVEGDFAITEQLLAYDPTKTNNKDDLIDACAMGPTMVDQYLPIILQQYAMGETNMIQTGYEVCSI